MKRTICLLALPILLGGCMHNSDVKGLTIAEKQLLDARHEHLRCEVKLDRLRQMYQVPLYEKEGGLLGDHLVPVRPTNPGSGDEPIVIGHDAPLTIGHDAPLTGGHDAPLTIGHDDPLTGSHDQSTNDELRAMTVAAAKVCWNDVSQLVNRYNECVVDYETCVETNGTDCEATYESCITAKRNAIPAGQDDDE
jgi:hypothetical protein